MSPPRESDAKSSIVIIARADFFENSAIVSHRVASLETETYQTLFREQKKAYTRRLLIGGGLTPRLTMAHADELSALLLKAIGEIDIHKRRLQASRNLWTPAKLFADKLHALVKTRPTMTPRTSGRSP
jgi:hypothetical protein